MTQKQPYLADIDYRARPVADLMHEMGQQMRARIKQRGTLAAFANQSGIPTRTLTRLVNGEDVGTETLYRALRALERWDVIHALLQPPEPTPLDLLERQPRQSRHAIPPATQPPFEAHLAKSRQRQGKEDA